ncbi:glycosyltransferase [Legionella spiritensis]|uniref:Glycosyl transferases group 1 n=1 Tax=Legionella spiritensis TaxID=452 RepID=A0A0W0YYP3_LEGSP|nr:glycosyltransferase [Legionella spiritensis]KTD62004.1 hypothetical protein Lspi_1854 [Legionella spiritensis]SNV34838.1 Uncharacterised protein [Legionella spiritensis]
MRLLSKLFKKRRSVVFYRHSYYHFYYLAKALRARGWDAIVVNLEPENGANANFYHGEDINLYDEDPIVFKDNICTFFKKAKKRFQLMHFAGDGYLSFFPEDCFDENPGDILEWKRLNKKIAYTISGCNSGIAQSSISKWSKCDNGMSVCDRCIWQDNQDVCNDTKNLNWGRKVQRYCDLIFAETLPALDYMQSGNHVFREPVTLCMDPDVWAPEMKIPDEHIIEKKDGEILVYHAVGNLNIRSSDTRNIKGTPYVFEAIDRLKNEGHNIRLIFFSNKPNTVIRYYQAQADIIVDQLNFGRYGATAREGMMLGKPVLCYMNKFEYQKEDRLHSIEECPIVSATEQSVYDELKKLVIDSELRRAIGKESRQYALKWHSQEACAERYEMIYDALFSKGRTFWQALKRQQKLLEPL